MWPDGLTWFLVFARVGAVLSVFPLTASPVVPVRVRIGLAAVTCFLVTPLVPPAPAMASGWNLGLALFTEISSGLMLGFLCRFVFYALEVAGSLIATEMGLAMASNFSPLAAGAVTAPGTILFWLAVMLMLGLDLHHWLLAAFLRSFELLPLAAGGLSPALLAGVVGRSGDVFVLALQIAAPLMGVTFVLTLVFCVLARAVPPMNVFAESFPVRTLISLTTFGACCHLMASHIANHLQRLPGDVTLLCQLLAR